MKPFLVSRLCDRVPGRTVGDIARHMWEGHGNGTGQRNGYSDSSQLSMTSSLSQKSSSTVLHVTSRAVTSRHANWPK